MEVTSPLFDRLKESQDDSIPNVNSSDTVNESPGVPLSWFEARSRLKKVLEEYISEPPVQSRERRQPNPQNISRLERTLEWWLDCDMDLYLGSLLFSAMFFLQCMISLFRSKMENGGLYFTSTSLLSASIIFLLTSIISWRLLQRRRRSREEDGEVAKMRRLVSSFIHFLKSNEEKQNHQDFRAESIKLSGTSLTDIFSVYRYSNVSESRIGGEWHRIPSLLLVDGDFISLQTGDRAPADCKLVSGIKFGSSTTTEAGMKSTFNRLVRAGETIQGPDQQHFIRNPMFPPGKTTVSAVSRKLLPLCSGTKVYVVQKTPIDKFLRRAHEPSKSCQIHRKILQIRQALYLYSIGIFMVVTSIILVRSSVGNIDVLYQMYLPFLATIGSLPISSPIILYLLEILGTARILVTVHPFASHMYSSEKTLQPQNDTSSLFLRYFVKGVYARLFGTSCTQEYRFNRDKNDLVDFPPVSSYLLERLGVVTALALVDDELVCDPNSTPQQLMIPSENGLKLLDLYPKFEEDDNISEGIFRMKKHTASNFSSRDSESDWGDDDENECAKLSTSKISLVASLRRKYRRKTAIPHSNRRNSYQQSQETEVQFEDPSWWYHLPSLKCIGLACLLVDDDRHCHQRRKSAGRKDEQLSGMLENEKGGPLQGKYELSMAHSALIRHVCQSYNRKHILALSHCIGFSTEPNSFGSNGDISPFIEKRRLHVIATRLIQQRIEKDRHALGLEESRTWGLLRPDATSILVKDIRSQSNQLLTVGDARLVVDFCSDLWHGENSTITPLRAVDRQSILENSNSLSLADLDVTAFSYAPIPCTDEEKFGVGLGQNNTRSKMNYLIDNRTNEEASVQNQKEANNGDEWLLLKNQIFLGLLGSSVSPRKEIFQLLDICSNAGVRFVYFSPRNMRRTKELAGQMGMEMSWNCAISLRALNNGEEADKHRMTSSYADWDVNAKLPHGVKDVKRHIEDIDNVPLLVSLFTDVTKTSTSEMVEIFQEHNDTVLTLGLSHISSNSEIFCHSDLSMGFNALFETPLQEKETGQDATKIFSSLHPIELSYVSSISSHSCVFNFPLNRYGLHPISQVLNQGRGALSAGTNAGAFLVTSSITFSLTVFLSSCNISCALSCVPGIGGVLYLQLIIPILAMSMSFTEKGEIEMNEVPPKNDESISFGRGERKRLYVNTILRAIPPALSAQVIYALAYCSHLITFEKEFLSENCAVTFDNPQRWLWVSIIRCDALSVYYGPAAISSGCLMISELVICGILLSASYISGTEPIWNTPIWNLNRVWMIASLCCALMLVLYLSVTLGGGEMIHALPWYFYAVAFLSPLLSLLWSEYIKTIEKKHENRAKLLRRLQFETKLGMYSPRI